MNQLALRLLKQMNNSENLNKASGSDLIELSKESNHLRSQSVKQRLNQSFKIRCDAAKDATGMNSKDFYSKVEISRQLWYAYSWGIKPFPLWLKIKLCDLFGKTFRDLFLQEATKHE